MLSKAQQSKVVKGKRSEHLAYDDQCQRGRGTQARYHQDGDAYENCSEYAARPRNPIAVYKSNLAKTWTWRDEGYDKHRH